MTCEHCGRELVVGVDAMVEVRAGLVAGVGDQIDLRPEDMDVVLRVCAGCVKAAAPRVAAFVARFADVLSAGRVRFEQRVIEAQPDE